ncbi:hypothetical protein HU200_016055 [Digitaria exilis]|uniref:Uncharacterized protein n=1 Tax=Digitaria exilis TaxID=1010633 RepID=A0A835F961_9POAL|nr:hypothetical protein HU200_016055 [Digitaria exilis]
MLATRHHATELVPSIVVARQQLAGPNCRDPSVPTMSDCGVRLLGPPDIVVFRNIHGRRPIVAGSYYNQPGYLRPRFEPSPRLQDLIVCEPLTRRHKVIPPPKPPVLYWSATAILLDGCGEEGGCGVIDIRLHPRLHVHLEQLLLLLARVLRDMGFVSGRYYWQYGGEATVIALDQSALEFSSFVLPNSEDCRMVILTVGRDREARLVVDGPGNILKIFARLKDGASGKDAEEWALDKMIQLTGVMLGLPQLWFFDLTCYQPEDAGMVRILGYSGGGQPRRRCTQLTDSVAAAPSLYAVADTFGRGLSHRQRHRTGRVSGRVHRIASPHWSCTTLPSAKCRVPIVRALCSDMAWGPHARAQQKREKTSELVQVAVTAAPPQLLAAQIRGGGAGGPEKLAVYTGDESTHAHQHLAVVLIVDEKGRRSFAANSTVPASTPARRGGDVEFGRTSRPCRREPEMADACYLYELSEGAVTLIYHGRQRELESRRPSADSREQGRKGWRGLSVCGGAGEMASSAADRTSGWGSMDRERDGE